MYQVIEQTDDEKRKMYSKMPKSEIIDMLIECNKQIEMLTPGSAFVARLDFPRDSGGNVLRDSTKFIHCPDIGGQAAMDISITTI